MSSTSRRARAASLAAAGLLATAAALFATAPASADSCLAAHNTADGGITATNSCLSSTIWVGIDIWGQDAPCRPLDGPLTNGHGPGGELRWNPAWVAYHEVSSVDVYSCA